MKSTQSSRFSSVASADIQRSSFDLSHGHKTAFDSGLIVPILAQEALPGDTWNVSLTAMARMATPVVPIMDNLRMDTFFFAVPHRLLWENWQRFCGEQDSPQDSTDYLVPQITLASAATNGSIYDYLGIPTNVPALKINALHLRAYNLIWNEWFRDQNIQGPRTMNKGDGPDPQTDYTLARRGKRHDYFTSCLPFPQKSETVPLPLGAEAPVIGLGAQAMTYARTPTGIASSDGTYSNDYQPSARIGSQGDDGSLYIARNPNFQDDFPYIFADLSQATASTINELRQAFQIQRLFERDARGGTRYTEIILSHFGVRSPDERLQRPEYLGGGSTPINISPIAQTAASQTAGAEVANTPQGHLAAIGTANVSGNGFTKSFTEHCVILGFVSVRADLTYQQGLDRMWSRRSRFDYYWPALAHLGEQAVLQQEIYATNDDTANQTVFGYQERYAEYRFANSKITGKLRSNDSQSLDVWHLAQEFSAAPTLNTNFIQEAPPMDRVLAVTDEPEFIFDSYFNCRVARPMPMYGTPGLIDHF